MWMCIGENIIEMPGCSITNEFHEGTRAFSEPSRRLVGSQ